MAFLTRSACQAANSFKRLTPALLLGLSLVASSRVCGDPPAEEPPVSESTPTSEEEATEVSDETVEMKPTEYGLRFTPGLAQAMSKQFIRAMKDRYNLDEGQAEEIRPILANELMRVAQRTQKTGRDVIENMVVLMVENDGRIPKESQTDFALQMKPVLPEIKDFFKRTATQVSKRMTASQRLKFTGDMAGVTAGFAVLETRMKKWEEGKHSDSGNPFFDPQDGSADEATSQPDDPTEHPEHRRARKQVERWIDWQINIDRDWEDYVKRAIEFYKLNEPQSASARSILKDMQERAKAVKTDTWRKSIVENRVARQMTYRAGGEYSQGPWMYRLENEYEKALKPLKDMDQELKARIESLPDSKQRETALEDIRKKLDEKGAKRTAS